MPQGVEHSFPFLLLFDLHRQLFSPLMPQGVEHTPYDFAAWFLSHLFSPLMPQGVEHEKLSALTLSAAGCFPL